MGVPKIVIASYTNCSAPDGFVKRVELFVISYFILLGDWFPCLVMLNYTADKSYKRNKFVKQGSFIRSVVTLNKMKHMY